MNLNEETLNNFEKYFGRSPVLSVSTPAGVNLMGIHTDYNQGFALPLALDRHFQLALAPRDDSTLRILNPQQKNEICNISTHDLRNPQHPDWSTHLRGAWWLLGQQGTAPPGADIVIGGALALEAGSPYSSASGVASIEAGLALAGLTTYARMDKALMAVEIERQFRGTPCDIPSRVASAAGEKDHLLLLDCRALSLYPVALPASLRLVILKDGQVPNPLSIVYAERRRECREAAEILGVHALRDADLLLLEKFKAQLGETLFQRAYHIITENDRVMRTVIALKARNASQTGANIQESHASLHEKFDVPCPEPDLLKTLADQQPACFGSRRIIDATDCPLLALVAAEGAEDFIKNIQYTPEVTIQPCHPADGSQIGWC